MNVAHELMERFQTASPMKLASYLGVDVIFKELSPSIRGIYIPRPNSSVVILNANIAELRQKFTLCYDLRKHIIMQKPFVFEPECQKDLEYFPVVFACDVLREDGNYAYSTLARNLLESGSPPNLVFGIYEILRQAHRVLNMEVQHESGNLHARQFRDTGGTRILT